MSNREKAKHSPVGHQAKAELDAIFLQDDKVFREILSSINDAVFITDNQDRFVFICDNCDFTFGFSRDEIREMEFVFNLLGPGLFDPGKLSSETILQNIEKRFVDKGGVERFLLITVKSIAIRNGTRLYTCRDITSRKKKEELLQVIQQVHEKYLSGGKPQVVFNFLLEKLVELTGSEYGFLDEVLRDEAGRIYKLSLALSDISWDEASRRLYGELTARNLEFRNLANLAGAPALIDQVIIANDAPRDPRSGGIPKGHPAILSFLGMPLRFGGELIGVAGVANRPGGYDQELVTALAPFLATCSSILHAVRQKRREEEHLARIVEARQNLSAILDASDESVLLMDPKGNVIDGNEIFARRLGYSRSELIGKCIFDFLSPEVVDHRKKKIREASRTGQIIQFDDVRDGRFFRNQLVPIPDETGTTDRIAVFAADITESRNAQKALEEREKYIRRVFESVGAGVIIQQPNGEITYANKIASEIFGLPAESILGKNAQIRDWQMICEDGSPVKGADHPSMVSLRTGQSLQNQIRGLFSEDSSQVRWFLINTEPIFAEGRAEPTEVIVTFIDISERMKAEELLRSNEEKYRSLFSEIGYGFALHEIVMDEKGIPVDYMTLEVNPGYEKILGVPRSQVVGKKASEFMSEEELALWVEMFGSVAQGGPSRHYEMFSPVNDRFYRGFAYSARPGQFAVLFEDITEEKMSEIKLKENDQKLEAVNLALEQKNAALREMMEQVTQEKNRIEIDMQRKIDTLVLPVIRQMEDQLPGAAREWTRLLKENVDQLATSKGARLSVRLQQLSKREMEICNLIRGGKTTKMIANMLNLSPRSIDAHRIRIRKKLGISNNSLSLSYFLCQEQDT